VNVVLEAGLNADAKRGIDYYIENVVFALAEADRENRYTVFSYFFRDYARKRARLPAPAAPNFELAARRFPESLVRALEERRGIPLVEPLLLGRRADVYHAVGGGRLPRLRRAKGVLTFFDLADETRAPDKDPGRKISAPALLDAARRADRIVATGEQTKKNLMLYYGLPEAKIAVIPTGVNRRVFRPVEDARVVEHVRRRYGLPERHLMLIGPFVPPQRNNAEAVLKAFAAVRARGAAGDCALSLVGARGPGLDAVLARARALGLEDRTIATGYAALEDLPALYGSALALVHPTSAEGFGFGLEAMACGVPFVTSNLPGVVEAVGDAALTVPPADEARLAEALEAVLARPALRAELRAKGLARAAGFPYSMVAGKLLAVYESLAREARA
jgi:glycosyltransferase involved in cell wall biosynthesis